MIDWLKNIFWYITDRALTAQERYDEVRHRSSLREIYLIGINANDVEIEPRFLPLVPDCFKTWEMLEKAIKRYLYLLKYVPDWFITDQQIKIWHDNNYRCNDDELIEWHKGYQKLLKRRALTHCLVSIKILGLVYVRRWKTRNRKIMGMKIGFVVSDDRIQKTFLTPKRIQNKDVFFS